MAAFSLSNGRAARRTQQVAQSAVELRRHSRSRRFGLAQCGDLQEQRSGIDVGMIVGQEVERHRGNFGEQFVERRCVGGGGDVVAVPAPDLGFIVPSRRNGENDGFRHLGLHHFKGRPPEESRPRHNRNITYWGRRRRVIARLKRRP